MTYQNKKNEFVFKHQCITLYYFWPSWYHRNINQSHLTQIRLWPFVQVHMRHFGKCTRILLSWKVTIYSKVWNTKTPTKLSTVEWHIVHFNFHTLTPTVVWEGSLWNVKQRVDFEIRKKWLQFVPVKQNLMSVWVHISQLQNSGAVSNFRYRGSDCNKKYQMSITQVCSKYLCLPKKKKKRSLLSYKARAITLKDQIPMKYTCFLSMRVQTTWMLTI